MAEESTGAVESTAPESVPSESVPSGETAPQEASSAPAEGNAPDLGGSLLEDSVTDEKPNTEEGESEEKAEEAPEGAPETYEDFKAPEGYTLDSNIAEEFKGVAKDLNLSQDKAQEVVDRMGKVIAQRQIEQVKAISEKWKAESQSDPEIGGSKHQEAMSNVGRVIRTFAMDAEGKCDPDIAEFMALPSGNHKGLLKLLARTGRAISEAKFPQGKATDQLSVTDVYNMKL